MTHAGCPEHVIKDMKKECKQAINYQWKFTLMPMGGDHQETDIDEINQWIEKSLHKYVGKISEQKFADFFCKHEKDTLHWK